MLNMSLCSCCFWKTSEELYDIALFCSIFALNKHHSIMDRTQVTRFNTMITQKMFSIPLCCIVVVTYNYAHGMTLNGV